MEQRLGLTRLPDGTAVRFAVVGNGPVAIYVPGWVSHLELGWALPAEREFYQGLATGRTLVRYDRPGCGLSGRSDRVDLVELELEVLQLVAAAAGADRFDLIGASFGAPAAVLAEVRRILRPGGRFSFAEHVAAQPHTLTRWSQRVLRRPWAWVFEGCSCERDLAGLIAAAGFAAVDIRPYRIRTPFLPFNTHIAGTAVAAGGPDPEHRERSI